MNLGLLCDQRDALSHTERVLHTHTPFSLLRKSSFSKGHEQNGEGLQSTPAFPIYIFLHFSPNTCFSTKLSGAHRQNGLEGQAVYLELNAFLCFLPQGRQTFPAAPRLEAWVLTWKGGQQRGFVPFPSPDCLRPNEERNKDIVGPWGRHEKLNRGQGPSRTSFQEPGTGSLGDSEFQEKRNGPFLTLSSGPRRPGRICLFFSPQGGFPPLQQL